MFNIASVFRSCTLVNNCLKTVPLYYSRITSTFSTSNTQPQSDFRLIYRLPSISYGSVINKVKLYQSVLTVVLVPSSYLLESHSVIGQGGTAGLALIALVTNIFFYTAGHMFINFIGKVYVNEDVSQVKFSYIGFWGHRIDKVFPVSLIEWPSHETVFGPFKLLYTHVTFCGAPIQLKLNFKQAIIGDVKAFESVFGESVLR